MSTETVNATMFFTFQCQLSLSYYWFGEPQRSAMIVAVVFSLVLSPLIVCTNILVLIAILRNRVLARVPPNILLIGTAVSDACVGLFSVPLFATNFFNAFISREYNCVLYTWQIGIIHYFSLVSFLLVLMICVDRVLAIYMPFFYHENLHWKNYVKVTLVFYIFLAMYVCITITVPAWFALLAIEATVFVAVVIFSSIAHLAIYYTVSKLNKTTPGFSLTCSTNRRNLSEVKRQRRLLCLTFSMFASLICCYVPYVVTGIMWFMRMEHRRWLMSLNMWSYVMVVLKSLLNPILYCCSISSISKQVRLLVGCLKDGDTSQTTSNNNNNNNTQNT